MVLFHLMRIVSLLYLHNLLFSVLISAPVSGVCHNNNYNKGLFSLNQNVNAWGFKVLFLLGPLSDIYLNSSTL